ncbi:MAG TPA: arginase, partial [Ktedonobacter sp.]|nr:arginase [Ktedonobacter sp.]
GMILSALAGIGHSSLTNVGGWQPKIHTESIVVVGARDLDSGEQALLREHSIHVFTMSEIDQLGISEVMRQALTIAGDHNDGIHLSLDMDALDPKEAPGVGTPVRGGLTYREAHLAMELIADSGKLISMDVVEVNPILDRENATALLAVELVLSALGKKIL